MSPSSTVHGGQHDTKCVLELLLHVAFVADEIWCAKLEPARVMTLFFIESMLTMLYLFTKPYLFIKIKHAKQSSTSASLHLLSSIESMENNPRPLHQAVFLHQIHPKQSPSWSSCQHSSQTTSSSCCSIIFMIENNQLLLQQVHQVVPFGMRLS